MQNKPFSYKYNSVSQIYRSSNLHVAQPIHHGASRINHSHINTKVSHRFIDQKERRREKRWEGRERGKGTEEKAKGEEKGRDGGRKRKRVREGSLEGKGREWGKVKDESEGMKLEEKER